MVPSKLKVWRALVPALALLTLAPSAHAWGSTGHRLIGVCAIKALPAEFPAFLRDPSAAALIGEVGREPDRSRGAGQPHDADLDPGHFINVGDDGKIGGGPALASLPKTRELYETALRQAGTDSGKVGYLPYVIAEGWEQLTKDFAYYRVDAYGQDHAASPADADWFRKDMLLREMLVLRDLGYWSHFVGDAGQPMHDSVHYNAWGDYPDAANLTKARIHLPFEGEFVRRYVSETDVCSAMTPMRAVDPDPLVEAAGFIEANRALTRPLFTLWTAGGFSEATPAQGKAFAQARLSAAASELRDLVIAAWTASNTATVGYPAVKVADILSGAVPPPIQALQGLD